MRPLRCSNPGNLFEITTRINGGQKLLRPNKDVNAIIIGVIGRAQKHYDVQIHAFVFMSTHYHMLLTVRDADIKSAFVGFINCNITKKLNALNTRTGAAWQRRFTSIPVAKDRTTQVRRLQYLLSHGVKERLVERAKDWPGASSLPWLVEGRPIRGIWTSFTKRYYARKRTNYVERNEAFETVYTLKMSPLPCWGGLPDSAWRTLVIKLIRDLEDEAAAERAKAGVSVLGAEAVLAADPRESVAMLQPKRAPSVHAVDPSTRLFLCQQLRNTRVAYTRSSKLFRSGQWSVEFPEGTFRPLGGIVRAKNRPQSDNNLERAAA